MLLPELDGLLLGPDRLSFLNLQGLHLAAWTLLGDLSTGEAFEERLLPPHVQLTDRKLTICTKPSGGPFLAGVREGEGFSSPFYQDNLVLLTAPVTIRS